MTRCLATPPQTARRAAQLLGGSISRLYRLSTEHNDNLLDGASNLKIKVISNELILEAWREILSNRFEQKNYMATQDLGQSIICERHRKRITQAVFRISAILHQLYGSRLTLAWNVIWNSQSLCHDGEQESIIGPKPRKHDCRNSKDR